MICYEFPLNERIRTMLRLEDLYSRVEHFIAQDHRNDHRTALELLLEILDICSRADLKAELLQEMDRQKRQLTALYNSSPDAAIETLIGEIEASSSALNSAGKIGQNLRENEWLMSIKQRSGIPGGTCEFDLPSYHYWQQSTAAARRADLEGWLTPLLPLCSSIRIVLNLLRGSGKKQQLTALHGSYQQSQGARMSQLLRICLPSDLPCLPEVSANKYALNIRFIHAEYAAKTRLFDQDVPFELYFCAL